MPCLGPHQQLMSNCLPSLSRWCCGVKFMPSPPASLAPLKPKLELAMSYMGHTNRSARDAARVQTEVVRLGSRLISSHVIPPRKLRACRQHTPPPPPHLHLHPWAPGLVSLSLSSCLLLFHLPSLPHFTFASVVYRQGCSLLILGGPSIVITVIFALLMCVRAMRQQVQGVMLTYTLLPNLIVPPVP